MNKTLITTLYACLILFSFAVASSKDQSFYETGTGARNTDRKSESTDAKRKSNTKHCPVHSDSVMEESIPFSDDQSRMEGTLLSESNVLSDKFFSCTTLSEDSSYLGEVRNGDKKLNGANVGSNRSSRSRNNGAGLQLAESDFKMNDDSSNRETTFRKERIDTVLEGVSQSTSPTKVSFSQSSNEPTDKTEPVLSVSENQNPLNPITQLDNLNSTSQNDDIEEPSEDLENDYDLVNVADYKLDMPSLKELESSPDLFGNRDNFFGVESLHKLLHDFINDHINSHPDVEQKRMALRFGVSLYVKRVAEPVNLDQPVQSVENDDEGYDNVEDYNSLRKAQNNAEYPVIIGPSQPVNQPEINDKEIVVEKKSKGILSKAKSAVMFVVNGCASVLGRIFRRRSSN